MTSKCFNCDSEIGFGNFPALPSLYGTFPFNQAYMEDFCSPECYHTYVKKYPDFYKRGEYGCCSWCGSSDIEIMSTNQKQVKAGNILTDQELVLHELTEQQYKCQNCQKVGQDMILGNKVE